MTWRFGQRIGAVVTVSLLARAAFGTAAAGAGLMVLIGLAVIAFLLHVWSRRTLDRTLHRFHDSPEWRDGVLDVARGRSV